MNWDLFDFLIFGTMLAAVAIVVLLARRWSRDRAYRVAATVAAVAGFLLVWVNGAVGIIGSEANDANLLFFGVLAVAAVGALIARFRAAGMAIALYATACAQVLVAAVAITMRLGESDPVWPRDILVLTAVFAAFWIVSGWLFGRAARNERRLFAGGKGDDID